MTWTSFGPGAETYLSENQDRLLTGNLSTRDFLANLDKAFKKDLDEKLIPPVFDTAAR